MPIKSWSTTDSENDDSDLSSGINWKEGQAPSTINNSARGMMTQAKRWFDEVKGGTVFVAAANVAGTANAVTLTTDQTEAYAAGQRYMFIAESANTGAVTIDKDGEGTRAVKSHGDPLAANAWLTGDVVIIADDGTDYELIYPRRQTGVDFELVDDDAGAAAGPELSLYRNSASPAASDAIGQINFYGEDSAGNKELYAFIQGKISDPTTTSEDAQVNFSNKVAGSATTIFTIGAGLFTPNATDGDKGADTINASALYADGVKLTGTVIARLEDRKAQNTDGGTFTSGAVRTRDLNTEVYDPYTKVSITSNQFTLQAGDYLIEWSAPAHRVDRHQSLLYDITGAAEVARGTTCDCDNIDSNGDSLTIITRSEGGARVSLASANVYEIRHECETTRTTTGFGRAGNFGGEVYTWVRITAA